MRQLASSSSGNDEATKSYPSHAHYNDGSDGEWESRVSGDTWTLTGSQGENGSMKVRCITVFSDAGETRSGKWDYSKDGADWRVLLDSIATKV